MLVRRQAGRHACQPPSRSAQDHGGSQTSRALPRPSPIMRRTNSGASDSNPLSRAQGGISMRQADRRTLLEHLGLTCDDVPIAPAYAPPDAPRLRARLRRLNSTRRHLATAVPTGTLRRSPSSARPDRRLAHTPCAPSVQRLLSLPSPGGVRRTERPHRLAYPRQARGTSERDDGARRLVERIESFSGRAVSSSRRNEASA